MTRTANPLFFFLLAVCVTVSSAPTPGEVVIDPPKEDWVMLSSTAFFRKPTTLIEHRRMPKLRGILSTRRNSLKAGQTFKEKARLTEACANIRQSYAVTKTHVLVNAKVLGKKLPYCRVQVQEQDGLNVDQLIFVSLDAKKARMVITHTVTFFYPKGEEEPAAREAVSKFIASVTRRKDG
jgi:hypothetical protein